MDKYFSNFQCYDEKGRRKSIFAEKINNQLQIFILTCSKSDVFNKDFAKYVYNNYWQPHKELRLLNSRGLHPEIVVIDLNDKDSVKWQFQEFCNKFYYKKNSVRIKYEIERLSRKENHIYLNKTIKLHKKFYG